MKKIGLIPRQYRIEREHDNKVKILSKKLTKVRREKVSENKVVREAIDEKYAKDYLSAK